LEKWFAPHTLCPALDRTNRPFTTHIWDYLQSKHGDISEFTIRNATRSTVEELPVPKIPDNVIKVELMTNFVKAMVQNGEGFLYVKNKFPIVTLNSRKRYLKSPQIRQLTNDEQSHDQLK
jgi:hypothetical protein